MIINLTMERSRYQAYIKKGIINNLDSYLDFSKKVLFVIDDNVNGKFYEKFIKDKLVHKITANEKYKTMDVVLEICKILADFQFSRDDYIVSIGGGITSDIVGFAASIFKRGILWISIPTTTLAMIDASVGGKTGVNFQSVKNMLGDFYPPNKILIDIDFLSTLDKRNFNNGLCEALKMGITIDKSILELLNNPEKNITNIIIKSIKAKNKIVKVDARDRNVRYVLNYGHTFGHAFELIDKNFLHGEAILLGMWYVSSLKVKEIIKKYIEKFNLINPNYRFTDLKPLLLQDKKIKTQLFHLVIVNEILDYKIVAVDINGLKTIYERR